MFSLRAAVCVLTGACAGQENETPSDAAPADAAQADSGPPREICDGIDNDGDGEIDEGLLGLCGDCNVECSIRCEGRGCPDSLDATDGVDVVACPDELDGECVTLEPDATTGSISLVVAGCWGIGPGQSWYIVDFEAAVPDGASIELDGRYAVTLDDLVMQPSTPVGTVPPGASPLRVPDPLQQPGYGDYMEVRATLSTTGDPPLLFRLGIGFGCML